MIWYIVVQTKEKEKCSWNSKFFFNIKKTNIRWSGCSVFLQRFDCDDYRCYRRGLGNAKRPINKTVKGKHDSDIFQTESISEICTKHCVSSNAEVFVSALEERPEAVLRLLVIIRLMMLQLNRPMLRKSSTSVLLRLFALLLVWSNKAYLNNKNGSSWHWSGRTIMGHIY